MNKTISLIVASFYLMTNAAFAYVNVYGSNSDNSKAAKYYRGEISSDEYMDHLGVPKNNSQYQGALHGEIRRNDIGGGYTYKDNTGRKGELRRNSIGQGYTYRDNTGAVTEYQPRSYGLGGYDVYSNQ